jgi:hypothetical protein
MRTVIRRKGISVFALPFVLILYFLPSILAVSRKVPGKVTVIVLNVTLGWTFVVWLVLLRAVGHGEPAPAPDEPLVAS